MISIRGTSVSTPSKVWGLKQSEPVIGLRSHWWQWGPASKLTNRQTVFVKVETETTTGKVLWSLFFFSSFRLCLYLHFPDKIPLMSTTLFQNFYYNCLLGKTFNLVTQQIWLQQRENVQCCSLTPDAQKFKDRSVEISLDYWSEFFIHFIKFQLHKMPRLQTVPTFSAPV